MMERGSTLIAGAIDARDYDIGTANRENVQQFLGSIAIYPFAERLE